MENIELTKDFGGKHWFIKNHYPRCRPNHSTDFQCIRPLSDSADTLFLCLFRNPFDWLRSIHARPYHAGNHWGLSFSEFLRKPWHGFETSRLNPYWPQRNDGYWFIEEAENILKLRTEKITHLLKLRALVENVCFVNYEAIRDDHDVLRNIADRFQIKLRHPRIQSERKYFGRPKNLEFSPPKYPPISTGDLAFIRGELDWDIEGQVSYCISDYRE